jgi:hypothetical protein
MHLTGLVKMHLVVSGQIYCGAHSGSDRLLQPKGLSTGPTLCHGVRLHAQAL